MSVYHYRASNAAGETVSGALEADSFTAMEHRLRSSGVWLLEAKEGVRAGVAKTGRVTIKRAVLVEFFVQMSLLLRARINLPSALERVSEDFRAQRLGAVVADLHDQVTRGVPMHQAMAEQPEIFSPQVVAIVQAGEMSGKLPEVFESLASYHQSMEQLIGEVRQALIYPMMVTIATSALVVGLFTFIVPRFVDLLNGLSLQVPWVTRVVMAISRLMTHDWPVLLGLAVGVPVALKLALRAPSFARAFDRALMRTPVAGPLIAMFAISRFTQNLGMLYRSGIPLVRGLEICRRLAGNHAVAQALDEVHRGVSEGAQLSRCLARYDFFPGALITMISTGEASGCLDFTLQSASDYYGRIMSRRLKAIFSILDPVIMILLIGVVGAVALAVVLPILQLWQAR